MESSGRRPAEPEVPLADATIAAEIARAAAKGRGADRAPTLEQLLAAFGEHAATDKARRRVRAALRMADLGVRPDLLDAEPGQRLLLLPPGVTTGRGRSRALGGLLALAAVLIATAVAAALLGGSNDKPASDALPAGPSTTAPASNGTPSSGAAPSTAVPTESGTPPTSTTDVAAQKKAEREARARRRRAREKRAAEKRRKAAAARRRKTVTVRVDASNRPTFLCVEDGKGNQLFGGTLDGKKTFKGREIRLNVGLASTQVTVNGQPVRLSGSPAGLDITRKGGAKDLPKGKRPCA